MEMPDKNGCCDIDPSKCAGMCGQEYSIVEALRRENEELKAKLDKAKWQPIETLPQKDFMFTGYSKAYGAIPIRLTAAVDSDGNDLGLKFFCGITWGDAICVSDITHWMPLPDAPEQH